MGKTSDYPSVAEWNSNNGGYLAGQMVKYQGNIFVAQYWVSGIPGGVTSDSAGWALYDELYDVTTSVATTQSKVVAYLPTWRQVENFAYSDPLTYKSLTHVIISFLMFSSASIGQFDTTSVNDVKAILPAVMAAAKPQNINVMIALGGATDSAFYTLMATVGNDPNSIYLGSAAQKVSDFIVANNLDGVDLDLECWWGGFDGVTDQGGRLRSSGPHPAGKGLNLFAQRLRALMPSKIITAAVFGSSWYGNNYDPSIHQYLNWIGIMTYDFTGAANNSPVGPHSAIFKIRNQSQYQAEQQGVWPGGGMVNNPIISTEDSLWYWTNPFYNNWQGAGAKVPRNKIMLGVPTYGYDFAYGKTVENNGGSVGSGYKVIRYKDIVQQFPTAAESLTGNIKVVGSTPRPSFISATGNYGYANNIYFESAVTAVEKQKFSKFVGCQGLIIWELSNDATGTNSLISRIFNDSGNTTPTTPTTPITPTPTNVKTRKSFYGTNLRGYPDGKVDLVIGTVKEWELWTLTDLGNNKFTWKSYHGTFLRASPNATVSLASGASNDWDIWTKVVSNGLNAWKSFNGLFMRAYADGKVALISGAPKKWDQWIE